MLSNVREQWFSNIRGDVLAGLVVGLALIPEAIAFSIIAGVDPKVGLYASFCIAVVISFVGGRPAMISAATGAMALLMVTLVKEHGLEYLLAATILTGVIQILAGYLKLAKLMRFVSKSVVIGFVNALAILIFMAQPLNDDHTEALMQAGAYLSAHSSVHAGSITAACQHTNRFDLLFHTRDSLQFCLHLPSNITALSISTLLRALHLP